MTQFNHLFRPIRIGSTEIPNRIVMPPMRTGFGGADGSVTGKVMDYYEARARGGAGLIVVEVSTIHPSRKYTPNALGLFHDRFIPGWRELAQRVHAHGAKIATELLDPGPFSPFSLSGVQPVGPSPVATRNIRELPRELSAEEIEGIAGEFAAAARRAQEAGLDAVEIHAAHDYALVGSFLSPFLNKRTDQYGGSLSGRVRFLLDILGAIRAEVGRGFPVIVRISGEDRVNGGRTIQETQWIAPMIVEAGADALEISGGNVPEAFWAVVPPLGTPLALNAEAAQAVKKVVGVPVICVGRINSPQLAEFLIANGKTDLVSMGRALIADPDLPKKASEGKLDDIAPCVGDNMGCLGTPLVLKTMSCIINPAVGREKEAVIKPSKRPRKVVVVGGGPAGLEAARVAGLRGHRVTLYEKEARLGGQVNLASVPPGKQELSRIIQYLSLQARKSGVDIKTGIEATPDLLRELKPDVVIVASGSVPIIPDEIPGVKSGRVVTAWDVLACKAAVRPRNVVILGGGALGCETSDFMAESGENLLCGRTMVTIVEKGDAVALDMSVQSRYLLMKRLSDKGVRIITGAEIKEVLEEDVLIVERARQETIQKVDYIVLALGTRPFDKLYKEIKESIGEVHLIGDARKPRKIQDAVAEGSEIGRSI